MKYSNANFAFPFDTFFTFALRIWRWLVVTVWLLYRNRKLLRFFPVLYTSCQSHKASSGRIYVFLSSNFEIFTETNINNGVASHALPYINFSLFTFFLSITVLYLFERKRDILFNKKYIKKGYNHGLMEMRNSFKKWPFNPWWTSNETIMEVGNITKAAIF